MDSRWGQSLPVEVILTNVPSKKAASSPRSIKVIYKRPTVVPQRKDSQLEIFVEYDCGESAELDHLNRKRKSSRRDRMPLEDQTNLPAKKQKVNPVTKLSVLKAKERKANFHCLPNEILLEIFRLLPALSRGRALLVCKQWNTILIDHNFLDYVHLDGYGMLIQNSMKHSKRFTDYFARGKHPELTTIMRCTLIDWLIEVGEEFRMQAETIVLTINITDRYLAMSRVPLSRLHYQLVGVTALLIASKIEETNVPTINDLAYICDGTYSKQEILELEIVMLNTLEFDLTIFSPRQYAQHLLHLPATTDRELQQTEQEPNKTVLMHLTNYLADLSLYDFELSIRRPSLIAAAAVFLARGSLNIEGSWNVQMQRETFYSLRDLEDCANSLYQLFQSFGKAGSSYQALYNKYGTKEFLMVSKRSLKPCQA